MGHWVNLPPRSAVAVTSRILQRPGPLERHRSVHHRHEASSLDRWGLTTKSRHPIAATDPGLAREPRYIILEKYLFKSREEFAECLLLPRTPTFVNQWMYGSKTFDCLFEKKARSVEVLGSGWGLSCNAVHWMDVMKRHLEISHLEVGRGTRVTDVFPSKRAGYEEIYGEFEFVDRDSDRCFKLVDRPDESLVNKMQINVDERVYEFDYATIKEDGKVLSHFPYFSSLIGDIVGNLMEGGSCYLPSLEESVSQHLLVEDILGQLDHRPRIT